ncbi:MAG TPA: hypothetical protein VKP30_22215 [Polyangiaceae bacterium]|nr:hypothetical protein [Polyangiaceae bacterium]
MSAEQDLREWIEAEKGCRGPRDATTQGWERLKRAVDSGDAPLAVPLSIARVSQTSALAGYSLIAVVVGALGTTTYLASSGSLKAPSGATATRNHLSPAVSNPIPVATTPNELVQPGSALSAPESLPSPLTGPLPPTLTPKSQQSASARAEQHQSQPSPARARRGAAFDASAANGSASSLNEELRLITNAKSALDRGESQSATAWLNEHRERFPSGFLSTERDALKLLVVCKNQKPSDAVASVEAFTRRYPESPFLDRIRRTCLSGSSANEVSGEGQEK